MACIDQVESPGNLSSIIIAMTALTLPLTSQLELELELELLLLNFQLRPLLGNSAGHCTSYFLLL